MIESGRLPLDEICTHQFPLADFQKGLDMGCRWNKVNQGFINSIMSTNRIINGQLASLLARFRHINTIAIVDGPFQRIQTLRR